MLKTEQILNVKFTPVSKGTYSAEEVDAFLKVVAQSYDTLNGEKDELIKKISILAEKIESYRSDEEAIKLSLLDAHRMAETIGKNATIKSDTLIGDAETRAQLIVDGANRQATKTIDEARNQAKTIVENARAAVASLTENAKKESDAVVASARANAAQIVADADAEGKRIIGTSKQSYEFYTAELQKLQSSAAEFKAAITALCNEQLSLAASVPEIKIEVVEFVAEEPVIEEAPAAVVAEEIPEIAVEETAEVPVVEEPVNKADEEEVTEPVEEFASNDDYVSVEDMIAELDGEIESLEAAVAEEAEIEVEEEEEEEPEIVAEEPVVYVPEEPAVEAPEEEAADEEEDDLFALIDDISFDDVVEPDSIPASLDDLVPAVAEEPAVEAVAEDLFDGDDVAIEVDEDDADDDFDGFKIDLDTIEEENKGGDDDDFFSLFDSMFDE